MFSSTHCLPLLSSLVIFQHLMDHNIFYKNYHHIEIIVILFTISVDGVLCLYSNSIICAPQNCGNEVKIEYPFWIEGKQESYCGSPGFNITCKNKNPVLKISGDDYIIRNISYANTSFLLSQAELYHGGNRCPAPQLNFSIEGTRFSYGPETVDLFFLYNCTVPYDEETFAVDCASNSSHHAFAVFHLEILEQWNNPMQSCQGPVNAPTTTDSIEKLLRMNFTQVLKRGFVLQWDEVDCRNCRSSGGRCGSSDNQLFICNCNDHMSLSTCNEGKFRNALLI